MKKENLSLIVIGAIALVVGFGGWYLYSNYFVSRRDQNFKDPEIGRQQQSTPTVISDPFDKPTGVPTRTNLLSVKGVILSIGDSLLTIEETLANGDKINWTVLVNESTEIVKRIDRPIEEVRKSIEEGNRIRPYTEESADFSAFETGQNLIINASDNIAGKSEFIARDITIHIKESN